MKKEYENQIKSIISAVDRTNYLYVKWAKEQGENYYESSIVYMIYTSGVQTQKDMVEYYGMPKQTVNSVIRGLVNNGYVILTVDENDKRSKQIQLTEAGVEYAKSIVSPLMACEKNALKKMGEERVGILIDTLDEYAMYLEEEMIKSTKGRDYFE